MSNSTNSLSPFIFSDSFKNLSNVNLTFYLRRSNFKPSIDWAKEKIELSLESIGDRYITYNRKEFKKLNQEISIQNYFNYLSPKVLRILDVDQFILAVDNHITSSILQEGVEFSKIFSKYINEEYVEDDYYLQNRITEDDIVYVLFNQNYRDLSYINDKSLEAINSILDLVREFKNNRSILFSKQFINKFSELEKITKLASSVLDNMKKASIASISYYEKKKKSSIEILKSPKNMSSFAVGMVFDYRFKYLFSLNSFVFMHLRGHKEFFINKQFDVLGDLIINLDNKLSTYIFKHTLITGEAMSGKTHMLSDIANKRIKENKPTILIYGQKFEGYASPVQHIIRQLKLEQYQYTDNEFLELINNWGKESNELVFLIVDALNETTNKQVWRDNFTEFVSMVKKYPYITLIMSIRDVEKRTIFTKSIQDFIISEMIEVEHKGFETIEYPVLKKFCKVFEVQMPKFPMVSPIFSNPGLLFLFFETMKRRKIYKIDESVLKPNFIIEEYIKDRNIHFKELYHIVDRRTFIHLSTNVIASKIIANDFIENVKYNDVYDQIRRIHNELLDYLLSEGVLLEHIGQYDEVLLDFSYQKFGNYFIALYLLSGQFSKDTLPNEDIIYNLFCNYEDHQALIEALIIRLSENNKLDFIDIFPELFDDGLNKIRYKCFAKSLKLPDNIEHKLSNFLIIGMKERDEVLDLLLGFAFEKSNQFNIKKNLHPLLLSLSLNERDYYWSIYIHHSFGDEGIVKRIISWAWDKKEDFETEDESLYLYGLTLGWFLTSSNRELRDGATKALVNLFTDRVDVFLSVLKEFDTVDDLYVLERLYAVGYGIVLRSNKQDAFRELGEYLYQEFFDKEEVIEHVLLRDYARLIIESVNRSMKLDVNLEKIRPPYNQSIQWELPEIDKEEVEKHRDDYLGVYASTLSGDFKKTIVYPLANHFLNLRIKNRPHPEMPKVRYDKFFDSLTLEQKKEYDKARIKSSKVLSEISNDKLRKVLEDSDDVDMETLGSLMKANIDESNFIELLLPEQLREYNDFIVSYKHTSSRKTGINVKYVKRLVFLEVIKLGWNKEFFELFDRNANNGRGANRGTERIGKKYQWIALYKVLSKLTDNYEFRGESYGEKTVDYNGMYQFSFKRDIDPTTVLKSKPKVENKWWLNIDKSFENLTISDLEWVKSKEKLPTINQLVNFKKDAKEYLTLHLSFSIDGHKKERNYRNLDCNIDSFVIKKDCIKSFIDWFGTVNYYGQNKLPQASSLHDMYLREYPDSDAFKHLDTYYHGQTDWEDIFDYTKNVTQCKMLLTSTAYMNEGHSYDKSVDETIEVALPNKWFVSKMKLKHTLVDGKWKNEQDKVVFCDPTVETGNILPYNESGSLLADKKLLIEFLESKGYSLVWIIWGEKQIKSTGSGFSMVDFLGNTEISGYGYFDDEDFVEHVNIKVDRAIGVG